MSYFNQIMELEKERDQVDADLISPFSILFLVFHFLHAKHANMLFLSLSPPSSFHKALRSRDSLQLEFTDCLLDKNRLRKHIAELQANLEQQQRELERERSSEQMKHSNPCLDCVS